MPNDELLVEILECQSDTKVVHITLNSPETLNSLTINMVNEISNLEINQVWEFQGMRVKRVQGSYVFTDDEFIINEDLADKVAQEVLLNADRSPPEYFSFNGVNLKLSFSSYLTIFGFPPAKRIISGYETQ